MRPYNSIHRQKELSVSMRHARYVNLNFQSDKIQKEKEDFVS